ncbi:MAG: membrane dipeptidase [Alphaproteobacteria bacterium]|nr:membrane dipeptidase [Alphaproteobacteria bacterium]|tara:strand:+ start:8024 stop:9277 length:1254 start_codon:yes stop_codon:yes gene_type:complete
MIKHLALGVSALALAACSPSAPKSEPVPEAEQEAVATPAEIHERLIVLDSHLDTPANFSKPDFDIMADNPSKLGQVQVDLPKMKRGGLDGGFWVIFTPQGPLDEVSYEVARDAALHRSDEIIQMVEAHPDNFELAYTADDAARIVGEGKRVVYQSIENSYPLGTDISLLQTFYDKGVRLIGPVHFRDNQFADSATDLEANDYGGLSPLGEDLIREANRLGMMIDGSHASDSTVEDIMAISTTPIFLSHTGVRALFDHPRNVTDELLKKVADDGGVIHINAYGGYIENLEPSPERKAAIEAVQKEYNEASEAGLTDEQMADFRKRYEAIDAEFPAPMSSFDVFMDQMLYALKLVGPDHVGMGADWDGGGGVEGMEDVSFLPKVTARLMEEGYTEEDLEKIWGGNMLRVLREVEAAKEQ